MFKMRDMCIWHNCPRSMLTSVQNSTHICTCYLKHHCKCSKPHQNGPCMHKLGHADVAPRCRARDTYTLQAHMLAQRTWCVIYHANNTCCNAIMVHDRKAPINMGALHLLDGTVGLPLPGFIIDADNRHVSADGIMHSSQVHLAWSVCLASTAHTNKARGSAGKQCQVLIASTCSTYTICSTRAATLTWHRVASNASSTVDRNHWLLTTAGGESVHCTDSSHTNCMCSLVSSAHETPPAYLRACRWLPHIPM